MEQLKSAIEPTEAMAEKTTAVTRQPTRVTPIIPRDYDGYWRLATGLFKSGWCPKDYQRAEQVFVALQMGAEVGLMPMQAVQNICVINGRPSLWGDAVLALVSASGLLLDFDERFEEGQGDDFAAVCEARRDGRSKPIIRRFSVADAQKAGLWDTNVWAKYPKRMLQMRARSWALRDGFPDVLKGLRVAEEERDYALSPMIEEIADATTSAATRDEAPAPHLWEAFYTALPIDPDEKTHENLETFVMATAKVQGLGLAEVLATAIEKMDEFWPAFEAWEAKKGGDADAARPEKEKQSGLPEHNDQRAEREGETGEAPEMGDQAPREGLFDGPEPWKPSKTLKTRIKKIDKSIKIPGAINKIRAFYAQDGRESHEEIEPLIQTLLRQSDMAVLEWLKVVLG